MKILKLSDKNLEYVKSLVTKDITESACDLSFFLELKIEPKDFIDQMTAVAKMFGLDFWEVVKIKCSDVQLKRMHVLYESEPGQILIETTRASRFETITVPDYEIHV